ncbi:MAG: hypothetical protein ACRYF3_07925, partial [Janthinobacterium lividum]
GLILGLVARGRVKNGEISSARVTTGIAVSAISLALGAIGWFVVIALISTPDHAVDDDTATISAPSISAEAPATAPTTTDVPAETPTTTDVPAETPLAEVPTVIETTDTAAAGPQVLETAETSSNWTIDDVEWDTIEGTPPYQVGTARATNTTGDVQSGKVKVTVLLNGSVQGYFGGVLNDVAPGETVTLDILGAGALGQDSAYTIESRVYAL